MRTNSTRATNVAMTSSSSRFTIGGIDDEDELMQRVTKAHGIDSPEDFERMQNYGFTSSLLDQDEDKKQDGQQGKQGGSGGGSGGGFAPEDGEDEKPKGKGAEGAVIYPNGDRSHPLLIAADDRRHRPYGIPKGGSAQYDQHGQMTYLKSGGENQGIYIVACDTEEEQKSGGSSGGSGSTLSAEQQAASGGKKKTERMASLRHVEKEKQDRKLKSKKGPVQGAQGWQQQKGGQQQQQQKKKEYKHEGEDDKVNHEVRVTKGRIEFRSGKKVVGYYDAKDDTWFFTGKVIHNKATSQVKDEAPKIDHN